jgi:signal transduction histidine kinase
VSISSSILHVEVSYVTPTREPGSQVPQEGALRRLSSASIGAKLTLRYTLAVSVTVTAVAIFVYLQVAHRINREARLLLELQAQELAHDFEAQAAEVGLDEAVAWMTTRAERLVKSSDPGLRLGIELVSRDGARLCAAGSLAEKAPPVSQAVLDGRRASLLRAVNVGEVRPHLSMAVGLSTGALQLTIDTERYAQNVRHVRDVLLWSLPVVLLATAGIGWLLARGSLRPISQITQTARRISAANLQETVPESGSGDELDRLAATLNDMLRRLSESLDGMRRFNANAAHQLRTPLTALSSELEVTLDRGRSSDEYQRVLEDALERVRQLAQGVDAMLRLSRVEAGLEPQGRGRVRLAGVLETVCEFFEPLAEDRRVKLEAAELPGDEVTGDASWLHELFSNLIANALQHTPPGGRVRLSCAPRGQDVVVVVCDTGAGMDAAAARGALDRFTRAPGATSGFGLGLPIASEIARAHGGSLVLQSEPGKGTTVEVRLPRSPEAPE